MRRMTLIQVIDFINTSAHQNVSQLSLPWLTAAGRAQVGAGSTGFTTRSVTAAAGRAPMLKRATADDNRLACCSSDAEALADSTSVAFCCVTRSISFTAANLVDTAALLIRGRGNLAHDIGDARHRADNLLHGIASAADLLRTGSTRCTEFSISSLISFAACAALAGCALRPPPPQNRALLTGTRRFYRGVKRQNVGLESDTVDDAGNVGDFSSCPQCHAWFSPRLPPRYRLYRRCPTRFRQLRGLTRVVSILLHGRGQLFHAGGGLFQ